MDRSPGSTIAASEVDDQFTGASSPVRADPRSTLQHVLGNANTVPASSPMSKNEVDNMTEDDEAPPVERPTPAPKAASKRSKGGAGANGGPNASIYSGNKVRHLKKEDGEPLWRKDIQYDFLYYIFNDDTRCFTNSYEPETLGKQTFAELYIDAMARSSKTSKILRDKLLSDHEPAKNMAMVCLLVNLGRMNTTLNCKSKNPWPHQVPS
jgi:Ino eighty subunit 1